MALPRFIEIEGRRYLWRDLVALRRAQATPAEQQPALFALVEDHRPAGERDAAERYGPFSAPARMSIGPSENFRQKIVLLPPLYQDSGAASP
jgi:hypothetical protein